MEENKYSVMSLNLLTSGARLPGNPAFTKRVHAIQEMIQQYQPDIIGVQELTKFMFPYLSEIQNTYTIFGESRHAFLSDEYSSILFNKNKFEYIDGKTLWLSPTSNTPGSKFLFSQFPRIVTYIYLKDKQTQQTFSVFNTHLDANFDFVRAKQIIVLTKIIRKLHKGAFTIVTGDFNCTCDSKALLCMQKTKLSDLIERKFGTTLRGSIGSYRFHHLPIDHIFVSQSIKPITVTKITDSYNNIFPTDHYPVYAEFSILQNNDTESITI